MTRGDHRRSGGGGHSYSGGRHHHGHHQHGGHHQPRTRTFGDEHESGEGGGEAHGLSHGGHLGGGGGGLMDATFVWKLSKLGRIGSSRLRFDDDFADRLNYQYTGILLFLFIGLIGIRQYVGKPIQCWIPQEFNRGWEEYAENYCWVSNTYFAPLQDRLPHEADRQQLLIGYYQWAPIVMALQAISFYLPCLVWRLFMNQSGFNVRRILQMATDSNILLPEHTMKNVRFVARYMEGCIYRQRDHRKCKAQQQDYTSMNPSSSGPQFPMTQFLSPSSTAPPRYSPMSTPITDSPGNGDAIRQSTPKEQSSSGTVKSRNWLSKLRYRLSSRKPVRRNRAASGSSVLNPNGNGNKTFAESEPQPLIPPQSNDYFRSYQSSSASDDDDGCLCCCSKRHGNYLVALYFTVKLLYLTNIIVQLFAMEKFVGNSYNFYGLRVLIDLIQGREWSHSGNFPRVTFCDFEAKKMGRNNRYTLQCVLPLNMFLEKIYIFLWFWHCMVGIVTLSSFFVWFYRLGFARRRIKFIRSYLKIMSVLRDTDKQASAKFIENYLRPDCVFLMRLIASNVGDMMAGDLACELWHIYRHKRLAGAPPTTAGSQQQQQHDFLLFHDHHHQQPQHLPSPPGKMFDAASPTALEFMMLNRSGEADPSHLGKPALLPSPPPRVSGGPVGFVIPSSPPSTSLGMLGTATNSIAHSNNNNNNNNHSNNDDSIV